MLTKVDLRKQYKHLYNPPSKAPVMVDVPAMNFLMLDGHGDPNTSQDYREAIGGLYSVAYTLKFAIKKAEGIDYPVMALEGLWWVDNMELFSAERKDDWLWTMMIMQPEFVTETAYRQALEQAAKKKPSPALAKMRFEPFAEGRAAQIMHIGPFAAEGPTIQKLHQFIHDQGGELSGKHHEIYLSDPRKASPAKMKTVVRQPVRAR